jgi:hypothetical protein
MSRATELSVEDRVDELARLVDEAARLLGQSPQTVERGCELAARAWWLARPLAPAAAQRLNATLHRLTRAERRRDEY